MNDVFIPQPPHFPNPLSDLLVRMDSQDSLNQENVNLSADRTALLKELLQEQKRQGEIIAKIVRWIELQPKSPS